MSPREQPMVLVVDDNDASRFVKCQIVRRAGFEVVEATTGQGALDAMRRQPVDIVLLDVHLPDMSGIEVCARLKADDALSAVQVLQISATAIADADRVRGLAGGADAYLIEPANPEVVAATVGALMRALVASMVSRHRRFPACRQENHSVHRCRRKKNCKRGSRSGPAS